MNGKKTVWGWLAAALVAGLVLGLLAGNGADVWPPPAQAAVGARPAQVSLDWEEVKSNITRNIHRAPVPGGWLVAQQNGMTFVPDPEHAWTGKTE